MSNEVKINGTYPYDDYGDGYTNCWKKVRDLELAEAAKLAELPLPEQQEEGRTYLWLNKGYVLVGGAGAQALDSLAAAVVEDTARFSRRIPQGAQAVYLHDGNYSLIERTSVKQTRRE